MKPHITLLSSLISFLAIFVALSGHLHAAEPLPPGSLSGIVVGPDGKPIAGASVSLNDFDYDAGNFKPVSKTTTASDGTFHLRGLTPAFRSAPEMKYKDLHVEAAGFAPQTVRRETFSIFTGEDTSLGKIHLERGQILTGQVLDVDGRPKANAALECQARRYFTAAFAAPLTQTYRMTTDAQGRFTTPPLPVSFAGFTVRVPGRQMPWICVPVGPEEHSQLPPIHLAPANKVPVILMDDHGGAIAGAKVLAMGWDFGPAWLLYQDLVTDPQGRVVIDGVGRKIQMQIDVADHVNINWVLRCGPDGIRWHDVHGWDGDAQKLNGPASTLQITMKSVAWIEGKAIDAESNKPVHLDRIVRCYFDRKPSGEIVLNGCQSPEFSQDDDGTFRLPYSSPDEYHLTLSATGYHDAEAFTPLVKQLQPIKGIVVKMHKLKNAVAQEPAVQTISGTVTRDGHPVKSGWVALCYPLRHVSNKPNAEIARGRTVTSQGNCNSSVAIHDGRYQLNLPYQSDDWVIEEEEPGQPILQIAHVAVGLNEKRTLNIAGVHGGSIGGRVEGVAAAGARDTFAVAFTRGGLVFETPVMADGRFFFPQLPPGEYGLKAGNDAFLDAERPPELLPDNDPSYASPAEPWKRATIVHVEADQTITDVQLRLPEH